SKGKLYVEQPASASVKSVNGIVDSSASWTNALGQFITNGTNSLGQSYGSWAQALPIRGNPDGSIPNASVTFQWAGDGTNTVTVYVVRSADGVVWDTVK